MRKTVALFMDFLDLEGNNFFLYLSFKEIYLNRVMGFVGSSVTAQRLLLIFHEFRGFFEALQDEKRLIEWLLAKDCFIKIYLSYWEHF